jgi:ferredoxin-thioredoxin reductase catalytic subunit
MTRKEAERKKTPRMIANRKRLEILDWAKVHGVVINPSKGYEIYVDNILKFGYCPCDSNRPGCPCDKAEEEIKAKGHCLCRLFWRDIDTFKETLNGGQVQADKPD